MYHITEENNVKRSKFSFFYNKCKEAYVKWIECHKYSHHNILLLHVQQK